MTPRTPLKKVTVRLEYDQWKQLIELYPNVGYNSILRALCARHLKAVRARLDKELAKVAPLEDLGDLLEFTPEGDSDGKEETRAGR